VLQIYVTGKDLCTLTHYTQRLIKMIPFNTDHGHDWTTLERFYMIQSSWSSKSRTRDRKGHGSGNV